MQINATARAAIRKAISAHHGWDDLRREKGYSLASISKQDCLDICDALRIDIDTIVATAEDSTAPAAPAVGWNSTLSPAHVARLDKPAPAAAADFPSDDVEAAALSAVAHGIFDGADPAQDTIAALPMLRPWSADRLTKFDKVLQLVDDDASFSQVYEIAQRAVSVAVGYSVAIEAMRQEMLNSTSAPAPLSAKAATPTFIPPSWSREFEDFLSIHATIAIVGPSGNGKTTAARKLLEAAGYNVHEMDCTDATMPHDIIGRQSLVQENGATVTRWNAGPLATAFADPKGALLLNEYDALDPRTGMALQSALEAAEFRRVTSPDSGDQIVSVGPCPIILTLNTLGHGATSQYQGRNALDGANRDRVEIISTGYENEAAIMVAHGADKATAESLASWAISARATLAAINSTEILSNRRLITAATLMDRRGLSLSEATERAFTKRLDASLRAEFDSLRR